MPLHDQFHSPFSDLRHWESFYCRWAGVIADALDGGLLPEGYFAEAQVHVGNRVEADIAAFEGQPSRNGEVLVFHSDAGPTLVSAVELVSPRNNDRPKSRRDFAIKCESYLSQGVGLMIVDIVTDRRANLHNELIALLGHPPEFLLKDTPQYALSYQPVLTGDDEEYHVRHEPLAVNQPLPTLPLPLDKGQSVPLDLEET